MNAHKGWKRRALTAALLASVCSGAASMADPPMTNVNQPVPEPRYQVIPISDGGQHSVDSSWNTGIALIGPGDGVVAGINNKGEILFRAGGIYRWNGAALVPERRVTLSSVPKGAPAAGQTASASALAAWAINDAGDVLATGPGGLYLTHLGGSAGPPPDLIVPNLHPEHIDGQAHGAIFGGINNNRQIVGDIEVADGDTAGASSTAASDHMAIFWQSGSLYNIQEASVMTGKPKAEKTSGLPGTTAAKINPPSEKVQMFDWSDGPLVDEMIFVPCGINDLEEVIGVLVRPNTDLQLPVLWDGGHWRILQTPEGVSGLVPEGINNADDIVGAARLGDENDQPISDHNSWSPALRQKNEATLIRRRTAFDLNDCIPKDSGWHLIDAVSINDHGEIVGWGTDKGKPMAFLLLPLPSGTDSAPGAT